MSKARERHVPWRRCLACRQRASKQALIRMVRPPSKQVIELDRTGHQAGRGAYLCPRLECVSRALKNGRLQRALNATLEPETVRQLTQWVQAKQG